MFIWGIAGCLPNGDYQLTIYSGPVTSSIVGPMEESSELGPLRAYLPMEVVTISIYVMPVALSLMMWLVLMVEIPGVATNSMGMVPRGASRATSTSSGVCRQAITPAKLHSRVGGCMNVNACSGKEGLGGVGVLGGRCWRLYWYTLGELNWSHFWPQSLGWLGDLPSGHYWLGWM